MRVEQSVERVAAIARDDDTVTHARVGAVEDREGVIVVDEDEPARDARSFERVGAVIGERPHREVTA